MIVHKRKRGHGGLKFLAVLFVLTTVIVVASITSGTEFGQRVLGNREDIRFERTALTPRFGFASASLRITIGEMYNNSGMAVDLTTTRDASIDRASSMAKSVVKVERTSSEVSPGVDAVPFGAISAGFTEILTKDNRYQSELEPGQPWTRQPLAPGYYGSELDAHYIPMVDDIMGFELRDLPSKPIATEPQSGLKSNVRRRVIGPTPPSAVTTSFSYQFDLATFRRAVPILASRATIVGPPGTPVTLTIGFDDVGLLRFADVGIDISVAQSVAQRLGDKRFAIYHYTLEVNEISGDPVSIDVPTDVVDAPADGG